MATLGPIGAEMKRLLGHSDEIDKVLKQRGRNGRGRFRADPAPGRRYRRFHPRLAAQGVKAAAGPLYFRDFPPIWLRA